MLEQRHSCTEKTRMNDQAPDQNPAPEPRSAGALPAAGGHSHGPDCGCGHDHGPAVRRVAGVQKVGRNDPCPCGSGKKHKKCCGR
jgi:uncharacterized protein YecA (UPF0149 family)